MSRSDQQDTRKRMLIERALGIKLGPKWNNSRRRKKCAYCKKHFYTRQLTIDHIIPLSKGGTWHIANLVLACKPCNNAKADQTNYAPSTD